MNRKTHRRLLSAILALMLALGLNAMTGSGAALAVTRDSLAPYAYIDSVDVSGTMATVNVVIMPGDYLEESVQIRYDYTDTTGKTVKDQTFSVGYWTYQKHYGVTLSVPDKTRFTFSRSQNMKVAGNYTFYVDCTYTPNGSQFYGSRPQSKSVYINPPEVLPTGISLDQSEISMQLGSSQWISATVEPSNATNTAVTWTSSAPSVASYTSSGILATGIGTAVLTAQTVNGFTASCTVHVYGNTLQTVKLDSIHFPDNTLRNLLIQQYDKDGNGYLGDSEIAKIKELDLTGMKIGATEGIQYLTSLQTLNLNKNPITIVNFNGHPSLRYLYMDAGVSGGKTYDDLYWVYIKNCPELRVVSMKNCPDLRIIDASGSPALETVSAPNCTALETLSVTGCKALEVLNVSGSKLTSLDLSDCPSLSQLDCYQKNAKIRILDIRSCPNLVKAFYKGEKSGSDKVTYKLGTDYTLSVSGGTVVNAYVPLEIQSHPKDVMAVEGETVTFSIEASGLALSYRWEENVDGTWRNTAAPGADTPSITVTAAPETMGKYRCRLTDALGNPRDSYDGKLTLPLPFGTPDLILPEDIDAIGESAFEGIDAVAVWVPDGCASIGDYAFKDSSVKRIRVPANCALGKYLFSAYTMVLVYSEAGSPVEDYCDMYNNCLFMAE